MFSDFFEFEDAADNDRLIRVRDYNCGDTDSLEKLFVQGGPILPSTAVVKREAFTACGVFDTNLRYNEDPDMWLRIAARFPLQRIGKPLVRKRVVGGSLGSFGEENARCMREITEKAVAANPRLGAMTGRREVRIAAYLANGHLLNGQRGDALKALAEGIRRGGVKGKLMVYLAIALCPLPTGRVLRWLKSMQHQMQA